jgi:hypothetical protein
MVDFFYSLGRWQWRDAPFPGWFPPDGTEGRVDLASLPDQAAPRTGARPVGFFATRSPLGSDYALLGGGDCRDIPVTAAMRDAWKAITGVAVDGERLVDLLYAHLTAGSDTDGLSAWRGGVGAEAT